MQTARAIPDVSERPLDLAIAEEVANFQGAIPLAPTISFGDDYLTWVAYWAFTGPGKATRFAMHLRMVLHELRLQRLMRSREERSGY